MKKNYATPETESSLVVMAHDLICASAIGAPTRGQIGTLDQTDGTW